MITIYDRSGRVLAEGEGSVRDVLVAAVKRDAYLYGAELYGAHLTGAELTGADLHAANLRSAKLHAANLRSAKLRSANLRSATLTDANLYCADLRGADLHAANLRSAKLADITGHWHSHDVIAEVLRQAAGEDVERRAFAGLVWASRDWCWDRWATIAAEYPRVGGWARDVLRASIVEGDATVPEVLR